MCYTLHKNITVVIIAVVPKFKCDYTSNVSFRTAECDLITQRDISCKEKKIETLISARNYLITVNYIKKCLFFPAFFPYFF